MEVAVSVGREREVEGLTSLKVWDGFRLFSNSSEISVMVVERSTESLYRGRRRRLVPPATSIEIRRW